MPTTWDKCQEAHKAKEAEFYSRLLEREAGGGTQRCFSYNTDSSSWAPTRHAHSRLHPGPVAESKSTVFPGIQTQGKLMASRLQHCRFVINPLMNVLEARGTDQSVLRVPTVPTPNSPWPASVQRVASTQKPTWSPISTHPTLAQVPLYPFWPSKTLSRGFYELTLHLFKKHTGPRYPESLAASEGTSVP